MNKLARRNIHYLFFLIILTISLSLAILFSACGNNLYQKRMLEYYSNDDNYVELTGTVIERVKNGSEYTDILSIKITSSDDEFYMYGSDTGEFCLYSNRELLDNIVDGDVIIFKSAPRIFYDGQKYPIVSLKKGEQELLSFENGKNGYLDWIREEFK